MWFATNGQEVGKDEADQASAVAVLQCSHARFPVIEQPVDVYEHDGKVYVTATRKCEPGHIMLPPCTPKQSKVHVRSEHPYRAKITMTVRETVKENVVAVKDTEVEIVSDQESKRCGQELPARSNIYFVHPEFRAPKPDVHVVVGGQTAVADGVWIWELASETMHPFWAVGRLHRPRSKCGLETITMSCVNLGVVKGRALNTTRTYEVPFMTNTMELNEGDELIIEVAETTVEKKAPKRTWKD